MLSSVATGSGSHCHTNDQPALLIQRIHPPAGGSE